MPERIDAFTHILPKPFYDEMRKVHASAELTNFEDTRFWDIEKRLRDMEAYGVDHQVLMLALPPIWRGLDPDDALSLTRVANDEVTRIADEHPDAFSAVATLPFLTDEYADELERCIQDLDVCGVQIFSTVGDTPIDAPEFEKFYELVAAHDVPIWLHPQLSDWYPWQDEYELHRMLGWPFETSMALARLVFSGVLDDYDLDIVAHHMGGMIPHFAGRLETFYQARLEDPEIYPDMGWREFDDPVSEQFRSINVDTAICGSPSSFTCAHDFFGSDGILFGTDYPFGPAKGETFLEQSRTVVDETNIPPDEKAAIYSGNVQELLQL